MEKTVERLEAMFQKADSDINNLSQRLKHEFENDGKETANPAELVHKLQDAKTEFASLVQQAQSIKQEQQDAVSELRTNLNDVCQLLLTLQNRTGEESGEKPAELCRLEQFLGSEIPWGPSPAEERLQQPAVESADQTTSKPAASGHTVKQSTGNPSSDTANPTPSSSADDKLSPSKRRSLGEFVEVTSEEFESVSASIKGRVKLTEVNSTYQRLADYFKENKDCKNVSTQEMHGIGLRVTGTTGRAKLLVLKALKLIKLTPKGDVSLV